jgi:DNA-binding transcriptional LysR family regulator
MYPASSLEFRQLVYFQSVAEHLSFSRAALDLNIAQPALSRYIKQLENTLGVQLFDRNRAHVRLTPAGRTLMTHTQRLLTQLDIAVTAVQQASQEKSQELIIGTDWRVTHPRLAQGIVSFQQRYSQVKLTVNDLTMPEQIQQLRNGDIHLGFIPCDKMLIDRQRYREVPFAESPMVILVGSQHPQAGATSVSLKEFKDAPWLTIDSRDAHGYRSFIVELCQPFGFTPRFTRSAKSIDSLLGLVCTGEGVCLMPEFVACPPPPMVHALHCDAEPMRLSAVYAKARENPLIKNFIALLGRL